MSIQVGDRVRVDIPDASDPDHRYHGEVGEVVQPDPSATEWVIEFGKAMALVIAFGFVVEALLGNEEVRREFLGW